MKAIDFIMISRMLFLYISRIESTIIQGVPIEQTQVRVGAWGREREGFWGDGDLKILKMFGE
jgi:hypothetical protein